MSGRHVRVDGPEHAPVLVLANSLGTTGDMWDPQVPTLAQRFRVVRYEHRGHGGSPTPSGPYRIDDLGADLLGVLDEVGAERASVLGLSLGGMVAMWAAAQHPERIESLVLACTAPALPPAQAWHDRAAQVRASGPAVLLEGLLGRWFTAGFADRHPDVRHSVATMLGSASPEGYAGCCEALAAMDQWADLDRIVAPTLVIAGAEDPVTPPDTALAMHRAIRGSSLVVLAGAAHLANLEVADRFTDAVVDHLAGSPAARGRAVRASVLGEHHVVHSETDAPELTRPFVDFLTRYAWGDIWTRPGLDLRTRSCITIAALTALGREGELALHLQGARRNGLSDAEIAEVLLHTAVYAGVPASNAAFGLARRVLGWDDRTGR
jgi:3-oxoadipate enol-lactonase/4-carboxymuconolactone decarboxylase